MLNNAEESKVGEFLRGCEWRKVPQCVSDPHVLSTLPHTLIRTQVSLNTHTSPGFPGWHGGVILPPIV